jgi:hypothetical protein
MDLKVHGVCNEACTSQYWIACNTSLTWHYRWSSQLGVVGTKKEILVAKTIQLSSIIGCTMICEWFHVTFHQFQSNLYHAFTTTKLVAT